MTKNTDENTDNAGAPSRAVIDPSLYEVVPTVIEIRNFTGEPREQIRQALLKSIPKPTTLSQVIVNGNKSDFQDSSNQDNFKSFRQALGIANEEPSYVLEKDQRILALTFAFGFGAILRISSLPDNWLCKVLSPCCAAPLISSNHASTLFVKTDDPNATKVCYCSSCNHPTVVPVNHTEWTIHFTNDAGRMTFQEVVSELSSKFTNVVASFDIDPLSTLMISIDMTDIIEELETWL